MPASRSCAYVRSFALSASFAGFGRLAARSACHCAGLARYSSSPPRVAALRRSSREIVDPDRPICRAICRTPKPWACWMASSSRSANDRYRPDDGFDDGASVVGGMPPALRNHRTPTGADTPAPIAASSLDKPPAINIQKCRRCAWCATGGRPGEYSLVRNARSDRRRPAIPTSSLECCEDQLNPPARRSRRCGISPTARHPRSPTPMLSTPSCWPSSERPCWCRCSARPVPRSLPPRQPRIDRKRASETRSCRPEPGRPAWPRRSRAAYTVRRPCRVQRTADG